MSSMNRSTAREIAVHYIFEHAFSDIKVDDLLERELNEAAFAARALEEPLYESYPDKDSEDYIRTLVRGVADHGAELDSYIEKHAKGWRFSRIDRVAAAIMRVAMFEILYRPEVPNKVAINEAVEIAKGYVGEDVVKFVNGILGTFVREEFPEQE